MKHSLKITLVILGMFLIAQLIGLAVINAYSQEGAELPAGFQPPEEVKPFQFFPMMIIAFIFAVVLIFILMKFEFRIILRIWFFVVVIVALGLTLNVALKEIPALQGFAIQGALEYSFLVSLIIALPLAFYKIFKRNLLVHNVTELMVYPGIAAVFVPILNWWTAIILLLLLSVYDMYMVWKAGLMQKMAKFQMEEVKIFAGFFVPYADKKNKQKIRLLREKYKGKEIPEKAVKSKKIKISLAILGGGDVVFPIIFAGVVLVTFGLLQAVLISVCATIALLALLIASKKGKFYPAMPFITVGCLVGFGIGQLIPLISNLF